MDQWQVLYSGSARLGKQQIEAPMLLYTQRFTPYGPIIAGERGIEYFDLHAEADWGSSGGTAQHMPEDRAQLERRAGRVHPLPLAPTHRPLSELSDAEIKVLLAPADNGVGAWRIHAGRGREVTGVPQMNSAGQWYFVLDGAAEVAGSVVPRRSGFFVQPSEAAPRFRAGEDGLDLVVLQYGAAEDKRPIPSFFRGTIVPQPGRTWAQSQARP
jgi:hypothetical protein